MPSGIGRAAHRGLHHHVGDLPQRGGGRQGVPFLVVERRRDVAARRGVPGGHAGETRAGCVTRRSLTAGDGEVQQSLQGGAVVGRPAAEGADGGARLPGQAAGDRLHARAHGGGGGQAADEIDVVLRVPRGCPGCPPAGRARAGRRLP